MAISFIAAGSAQGTTITIPGSGSYASGDIMVMFAWRNGNTTSPSIPAGWTSVGLNAGTLCSTTVAFKVATSGSETSGTWTNATSLVCQVYRGQKAASPVVNSGAQTGTATTVNYSGIGAMTGPGTSWVIRFGAISTNDTALQNPPAAFTFRTGSTGAVTDEVAGFDTNGTAASCSFAAVVVGGTIGNFITKTLELLYEPPAGTSVKQLAAMGVG